jgi:hypothetical protein
VEVPPVDEPREPREPREDNDKPDRVRPPGPLAFTGAFEQMLMGLALSLFGAGSWLLSKTRRA